MSNVAIAPTEIRVVEVVELRAARDNGARVLQGLLVPYEKPAMIGNLFEETIAPGCFRKSISESARRLPLMALHDYERWPIGSADEWDDTPEGLRGQWSLADTDQAREVFDLVQREHLSGLSVGFQPVRSEWTFGEGPGEIDTVRRVEARLLEASVVPVPTWDDARVLVRSIEGRKRGTPRLDQWRAWLDDVKRDDA